MDGISEQPLMRINQLISILKGDALDITSFFEIADLIEQILPYIPNDKYNDVINMIEGLSGELLQLEQDNRTDGDDSLGFPHLTIAFINLSLSIYLEKIGLYAQSFNALSKSKDPCVRPFDFITREGNAILNRTLEMDLFLIDIGKFLLQPIRSFFLRRAYTHFKLLSVIGNVNNEAGLAFEQYKFFAAESELTLLDLKFYANYLEVYYTGNMDYSPDIERVISILQDHYAQETDPNHRFLIASTLAKALKEKSWIDAAQKEDSVYDWEGYYEMLLLEACFAEAFDVQQALNILWGFLELANKMSSDRMMFDLCKQKNSKLYTLLLHEAMKKELYEFIISLTYNWNAYKPDNTAFQSVEDKNICILLPNLPSPNGIIFILKYNQTIKVIPIHSEVSLNEIFALKNIIEESWQIIGGKELNYDLEALEEQQRQVDASVEYITKIREFININSLIASFEDVPKDISFEYIETTWLNIPILSVLSSDLSNPFFITSGYESSPASAIRKALIWVNDVGMSFAQFELEALEILLDQNNIQVDIYSGEQLTKELFLEKYQDANYDLLWIISHGQFEFNNPPNSYIYISPTETVTAWELQSLPFSRESRRRLILNACYSGCSDVRHNGMNCIGIAPSLVNPYQEVLGHLWFVHDLASATLGVFILEYILQGISSEKSVQMASNDMLADNEAIAARIEVIKPELGIAERIRRNTHIELKQPFYSMSSILYK